MGQVDRIPPITPVLLQTQGSDGVQMRKEGRQQPSDQPKQDTLELHALEEDVADDQIVDNSIDLFPEHGLDLTA